MPVLVRCIREPSQDRLVFALIQQPRLANANCKIPMRRVAKCNLHFPRAAWKTSNTAILSALAVGMKIAKEIP